MQGSDFINEIINELIGIYGENEREVLEYIIRTFYIEHLDQVQKLKKLSKGKEKREVQKSLKELLSVSGDSLKIDFIREFLGLEKKEFYSVLVQFLKSNNFIIQDDKIMKNQGSESNE